MPQEYLNYKKDKGMLSIEISIENIPTWNYRYRFDEIIQNDNAKNDAKKHDLKKPNELLQPEHRWSFLLTNMAPFPAPNVIVKMDWYQDQDGVKVHIHKWRPDPINIEAEKGVKLEDGVILNPQ